MTRFAVGKLQLALECAGNRVDLYGLQKPAADGIFLLMSQSQTGAFKKIVDHELDAVRAEGFRILRAEDGRLFVLARDERGVMIGALDLAEQLLNNPDLGAVEEKTVNPALGFRAIKFNLPWSPYRPGPATDLHKETCHDLKFWQAYLDMMAENRFNALSLWSTDFFRYMIRAQNYPKATPFSDAELEEWRTFWTALFRMANERGIETYLVNWNIVVSPEFAEAYSSKEHFDRSGLVKKYTRESVTQLINEYPDLTGLGVTLADWMGNWGKEKMTPSERESWIDETFVAGMAAANRRVRFIHRAVLAGDPREMRRVIDHANLPDKTVVEVKFNWSHGYSTPNLAITHANDAGTIMRAFWDPKPTNYFIAWMIRNEDFFVLRWGDPAFIRKHIATNHHDYVDGYFIGSEGFIPAKDYSHADPHPQKTWKYAFEKQWLTYQMWGRLTYNPDESDAVFINAFERRYGGDRGELMFKATALASQVPLHIASFFKGTWDFTLYSEGFLAPWPTGYDDRVSPFISIEELIRTETLDPDLISIPDYVEAIEEGQRTPARKITPLHLADQVRSECDQALQLLRRLRATTDESKGTLRSEMEDIAVWAHLGHYFADKLTAGVALERFRRSGKEADQKDAIRCLELCVTHWRRIIEHTESRYTDMPYVSMGHPQQRWPDFKSFHWKHFLKDVERDVAFARASQVR
jgi:hypothetical protein